MATRTNRISVDVNIGSPRDGHVPVYDETVRLWTTKSTSSLFPNFTLDQISGSIFANRTYTFPQSLRVSSSVSASSVSGSLAIFYDGYITNIFASNISASSITTTANVQLGQVTSSAASSSVITSFDGNINNIFTSFVSSSLISASTAFSNQSFTTNLFSALISSSFVTASSILVNNANISNIEAVAVSSSIVSASIGYIPIVAATSISTSIASASDAFLTNVYSTLVSASVASASLGFIQSGFVTNLFSSTISSSITSASNALLSNVFSSFVSSSIISASDASSTNIYSNFISSSITSASNASLTNVFSSAVSSSTISSSDGLIQNIQTANISSSLVTASSALITEISASNISASNIINANSYTTNLYSSLISSSIITGSNILAETASLLMLGIGTRTPEYPLDVKNTRTHGIRAMFGASPTSSVTIWDGTYQLNHPLRTKLPELDSSYVSIYNKKPYGGVSDDEYYQFVNFLELADYTSDDNETVYVMTNRSTYSSSYSHSAGIVTFANLQDNLSGFVSSVFGNYNIMRTFGPGTVTNTSTGLLAWTTAENSARVNTGYGVYGLVQLQTNASIGNYYNFYGITQLGTGGSINNLYGTYLSTVGNQSVSSINNYAGVVSTVGTITASNNTLLLMGRGTIPNGNYAIYNTSSYDNYIQGRVGIGVEVPQYKLHVNGDTNISGSLTVTGLLSAVSTSIQYITSSQLNVSDNRIVLNTNDSLRFGGISVNDSGSGTPTSGSLYWDSQRNHWLYETAFGGSYNSAILISGPKNTGTLGNETELTINKLVYAVGTDHIGDAPALSDGTDIFIENNLSVSGSLRVKQTGSFDGLLSASRFDVSGLTTLRQVLEKATITPSGINGVVNYDLLNQAVLFYTADATGNWSVNFRGDSGVSLNDVMKVGQSLTSVLMISNGSTPYNFTAHSIDGVPITPKWQHGEIPSYGVENCVEVFSYNIIKLAESSFSVLAARTTYI